MAKKLTAKQELFISEYLKDFNGAQAVIRAGYSKKGARVEAHRLLTNVNIQQYIREYIDSALEGNKTGLKKKIIDTLEDIAFIPKEEGNDKDRMKAMELLGKYIGLWIDKVEHSGDMNTTIKIEIVDPKEEA